MTMKLAIDGGVPVRTTPMPKRCLIEQEEKKAVMQLFDEAIAEGSAIGYGGIKEEVYMKAVADFLGGGFADGVSSGTNAVFVSIGALGLDAFSEIIVPAITDPGGVMPVVFNACIPIPADTCKESYNICAETIEAKITERTKAIIVAHIGGDPADMDPIMAVAKKHNLYVIEDCAQSHGAEYKGKKVGTIGDIAAFSTMFGKHHSTGGQGGFVFTKNEQLFWQAKRFADRGKPFNIEKPIGNVRAAINNNMDELRAVIGIEQLKKLPQIIKNRHKIGEAIKSGLGGCKAVSMGYQTPDIKSVYWFMRFKLELDKLTVSKEDFCRALKAEGIEAVVSYRHIPCEMPWFKNKSVFGNSGFPWTCSEYKGCKNPNFDFSNAISVTNSHFNIALNESYGSKEAEDIIAALKKVEKAYLK